MALDPTASSGPDRAFQTVMLSLLQEFPKVQREAAWADNRQGSIPSSHSNGPSSGSPMEPWELNS